MKKFILCLCVFLGLSTAAMAQVPVVVEAPWAMASIGDMRNSAAYFSITNKGDKPLVLRSARSPMASMVELHANVMDADIIRMRAVSSVDIAPRETLQLRPGAHHLMVMGLKQPLKLGDTLPITLEFDGGQTVDVVATVRNEAPKDKANPGLTNPHQQHLGGEED